ncbi:RNA-directed DNA polymerase, eukaryota, partial [Tanacetum coccineum]
GFLDPRSATAFLIVLGLLNMDHRRSNEDEACNQYERVIDVFIPNKRAVSEVSGWTPDFAKENDEDSDTDGDLGDDDLHDVNEGIHKDNIVEEDSEFEENKDNNVEGSNSNVSFKNPPGFTPSVASENQPNACDASVVANEDHLQNILEQKIVSAKKKNVSLRNLKDGREDYVCSGHFQKNEGPQSGGSILQLMDEMVKVGQVMGYNMEGCIKNIEAIIDSQGVHEGEWVPSGKKLLIISVYAPQELNEKKMLWDYLILVINNWNGEVIIMGDFNKVRKQNERFGSKFNVHGADAFNSFISNAGLEEVPLGGCSFTWCHKSATKMSKLDHFLISEDLLGSCPNISTITLDCYLSDHRPTLMHESSFDYGPIPFRFFHYWFDIEGFDTFVESTWNEAQITDSNAMAKLMKKLKYLKEKIRSWIKVKKDNSSKNQKKNLKN